MRRRTGWAVLGMGALLAALGEVHRRGGGTIPGSDVIAGTGAVLVLLGIGLVILGRRVRYGGEADWRNRALGGALGVLLSAIWRAAVEIAAAWRPEPYAWLGVGAATLVLLLPAISCWAYVGATFLPWSGPEPLGTESESRRTVA